MSFKRTVGRIAGAALVVFILLNVVVTFHAYKFTHFTADEVKRRDDTRLTGGEKLKTILLGVENSRPADLEIPSQKYETVYLQSNVKLQCWSLKADSAKGTVIIFHGYRASKSAMIDRSDEFLKLGYNTLLVDFMGSGGSEGNSTTIGYKEAEEVKTAFDYVASKGEKRIYLFGTSMGAAAVMKAVSDYQLPASGLFLECPFGTMLKTVGVRVKLMGLHEFPIAYLLMFWGGVENGFWAFSHNPEEYAKGIKLPVLLMYGEVDNRVSRQETDKIFENLAGQKTLKTFPLSGHEDYLLKYKDLWISDVSDFLKSNQN